MSYDSTAGLVGGLLAASALLGVTPAVDAAGEPDAPPGVQSARIEFGDPKDGKTPAANAPKDGKDPEGAPADGKAPAPAPKDAPKEPPRDAPKEGKAPEGAPADGKAPPPDTGKVLKDGSAWARRPGFHGILGKLD